MSRRFSFRSFASAVLIIASITWRLPALAGGVNPTLNVGTASGSPGATVQIPISITRNGALVTATSNRIQYDNTKFTPGTCVAQAPFSQPCPNGNDTGAATLNGQICSNNPPAVACTMDADCGGGNFCNVNSVVSLSLADCNMNMEPDPFVADGIFVLCPFTIAMGTTPGDYPLTNTASWSNAAGVETAAPTSSNGQITVLACTDSDGDLICDEDDNCPFIANPSQSDIGGINSGSPPDGIGDACQCGDVNGDGRVTLTDGVQIRIFRGFPPGPTPAFPDLCDVGATVGCSISDGTIIRQRVGFPPNLATFVNQCAPFNP